MVVALLGVFAVVAVALAAVRPGQDFSLGVTPQSGTVNAPAAGSAPAFYTATVTPSGGFTGTVQLSMKGCPTGVTCPANLSVAITPSGSQSAALSALVSSSAKPGSYSLTVKATSGKLSHSATVTLVIPAKEFSVAASPGTQTVTRPTGGSIQVPYQVTVTPTGGFTGSVTLSLAGCPTGVRCPAGQSVTVTSTSDAQSTLLVRVSSSAAPGSYTLLLGGKSGKLKHFASVTLVIQSSAGSFTVAASPGAQTLLQDDSTTFQATVTPSSFTGSVSLSVSGLPSGATAGFDPASVSVSGSTPASSTLTVTTASSTPAGTFTLTIQGTGGSPSQTHSTTVSLTVGPTVSFGISGDIADPPYPGGHTPLNLSITNPYDFTLNITSLTVAVNDHTSRSGCSGSQNFRALQYGGSYPISVPANSTMTLAQLGVTQGQMPQLSMLDTNFNQDACKGATITLSYGGSARR